MIESTNGIGGAEFRTLQDLTTESSRKELGQEDFMKLMTTQLQNQDPLNPLDNSQMLQQISQIREVGATEQLTETLDTLLLRQNVASATALIGQRVEGLGQKGEAARGLVDRVSIRDGAPELHVNGKTTAAPDASVDGTLEAGSYRYRAVFDGVDDQGKTVRYQVDVGPVETTGTPGRDRSILISNLPVTDGSKTIYRTDASGAGDYRLVGQIDNGDQDSFLDVLGDDQRTGGVLTDATVPHPGGRRFLVALGDITQIRLPDSRPGGPAAEAL